MALKIVMHHGKPVDEHQFFEMARVGYVNDSLEVQIWNREGRNIPHVHVYSTDKSHKKTSLDACIQLVKPMYFQHGSHMDTLNAEQRKAFNDFMHSPHRHGKFSSNYEYAVFLWNDNNTHAEIELELDANGDVVIPDYTDIQAYQPNRKK